jgi:hypothetical protein
MQKMQQNRNEKGLLATPPAGAPLHSTAIPTGGLGAGQTCCVSENENSMNSIEIKQRRKLVGPFFAACLLFILIGVVVGFVVFGYTAYAPIKKLLQHQPIIVLADDSIALHEKRTVVIPKSAIQEIEVVHEEDDGYFLRIKTEKENHKASLTWLDTTPDEIKNLIERYKQ